MGIRFKKDDGILREVNNQTGELQRVKSHEELQQEKQSTDKNKEQIVWDLSEELGKVKHLLWMKGMECEQLQKENQELKNQIQSITKLLM